MRGFMVLCIIGIASALPQGNKYLPAYGSSPNFHDAPSSVIMSSYPEMSASHGASYNMMMMMRMRYHGLAAAQLIGHNQNHQGPGTAGSNPNFSNAHLSQSQAMIGGVITKNFFIHSAPEETDEDLLSDSENSGPVNKKYNIVFIKSPTESVKSAALALSRAQSEEKTLIYVLSKKFDASDLEAAFHATMTEPTKPEVVFIKYKTPEEAALAQQQIQAQYDALGGGPTRISDEGFAPVRSFIGSLAHSGGNLGVSSTNPQASSSYLPPRV